MQVLQGQTTHFKVYYDDALTGNPGVMQPPGSVLAQNVLDYCEYDFARVSLLFGGIQPIAQHLPFVVNLVVGGPTVNNSNDGLSNVQIAVAPNNSFNDPFGVNPIVVVETSEIFMALQNTLQNKGWYAGWSAGEGLSRVFGGLLYPNHNWLVACGTWWFNASTHTNPQDFVDVVEHTDGDDVSYGCASLFLNYLAYQLNYTWPAIIGAGAPQTHALSDTAQSLGASGYASFLALLQQNFPNGDLTAHVPPYSHYTDDVFPLGPLPATLPALYMRHNLADDGTSHVPPLGASPDIIVRNAEIGDPQGTYSTTQSINSDTESDSDVLNGQTNYVYLRAWNRGAPAQNAFATVYWSLPSTLMTPPSWNLIGTSYFSELPLGSDLVQVSTPGIPWASSAIPAAGHYCFVATLGNNYQPAPDPAGLALGSFDGYVNFILANNNVTWRNFNVVHTGLGRKSVHFGGLVPLPFQITGAWHEEHLFAFETIADLPEGSRLALQTAEPLARGFKPALERLEAFEDDETDPDETRRVRLSLLAGERHQLGEVRLPAGTIAPSHLLVDIPPERHDRPFDIAIRQLYKGQEVGRITWRLVPE